MKKSVIYTRVSTDIQAEEGYGLQIQQDSCRKYVDANGFEVIAEISDDANCKDVRSRLSRIPASCSQVSIIPASGLVTAKIADGSTRQDDPTRRSA